MPVRLYSAARGETVSFNLLHAKDNSRIKQVTYCQAEDKPVPRSELVKGYEYEKDHYVVIDEEDIKKVAPKTAKVMEILEFVKGDAGGPHLSGKLVLHGAGRRRREALRAAVRRRCAQSNYYALAKIAMHNREHIVILRPGKKGILLHTMYYADEIRQVDEFRTDTDLVKPNELAMANMLIETLNAEFEPEKYHDTYRDNLLQMIEAKKEGQEVVETPEPHVAPVIDIMEALKRSLAEKKKPVQAATAAAGEAQEEAAAGAGRQEARAIESGLKGRADSSPLRQPTRS